MSAMTDYLENLLIDHVFRGQAMTLPTNLFFALGTAGTDSGITEVAGGSYARVSVARSLANFAGTQSAGSTTASTGTGGVTSNNADIVFPAPTANWGLISHVAIFDALTGGNCLFVGAVTAAKSVNANDLPPRILAGTFSLTLA